MSQESYTLILGRYIQLAPVPAEGSLVLVHESFRHPLLHGRLAVVTGPLNKADNTLPLRVNFWDHQVDVALPVSDVVAMSEAVRDRAEQIQKHWCEEPPFAASVQELDAAEKTLVRLLRAGGIQGEASALYSCHDAYEVASEATRHIPHFRRLTRFCVKWQARRAWRALELAYESLTQAEKVLWVSPKFRTSTPKVSGLEPV